MKFWKLFDDDIYIYIYMYVYMYIQKMRWNRALTKRNNIHSNHTWKSFQTTSLLLSSSFSCSSFRLFTCSSVAFPDNPFPSSSFSFLFSRFLSYLAAQKKLTYQFHGRTMQPTSKVVKKKKRKKRKSLFTPRGLHIYFILFTNYI